MSPGGSRESTTVRLSVVASDHNTSRSVTRCGYHVVSRYIWKPSTTRYYPVLLGSTPYYRQGNLREISEQSPGSLAISGIYIKTLSRCIDTFVSCQVMLVTAMH
eukprot:1361699-Amorphochlora_amoeboformis.AAC.1